jgi:capsular exopolysaccharide synthesis family protein
MAEIETASPAPQGDYWVKPTYDYSPALVTLASPLSRAAEAIRALRTHVLAQHVQAGRRALAVCGPSIDVGCTYVAANLAVALAQVGIKTLLVDADMRAPMIDQIIRPSTPPRGLVACLSEPGRQVDEYIDSEVFPNLSILYAGPAAANAQELLAREAFEDVMKECMREYEITIVDTPPANTCADARRISNVLGYSLVVARKNKSLVNDVKVLAEQLIDVHVKVIGTLMNSN